MRKPLKICIESDKMFRLKNRKVANPAEIGGFTLFEALTAATVFIIAAVSILTAVVTGMRAVRDISENALASAALQYQIETMRQSGNLPAAGSYNFYNNPLAKLTNGVGTVSVDQYVDANLLRVVVRVNWNSRLQSTKNNTKRLSTLIANKGLDTIAP